MGRTGIFKPLKKPPSLHVSVQESVKSFIDDNKLSAGDPLPPEGTLAQQLGVSRNSVREAIKALESVGILETKRGIGVFVKRFSFDPLLDHMAFGLRGTLKDVGELCEIRRALEGAFIGQSIVAMGEDDIAALRTVTARMKERAEHNESFAEEDQEFHQLLFRCQGNRMLTRLIDVFWNAFHKASGFFNLANPDPSATWRDHHDIVEAIAKRDADAARQRLDHHYHGILRVIAENQRGHQ